MRGSRSTMDTRRPILLVEDDPDIADACRELLEYEGYRVFVARTGAEGLALLHRMSTPCLVLLDVRLPDVDGLELIEQLQAEGTRALPIVVSTAGREPLAGHRVLRKPFEMSQLLEVVREHGC